MAAIELKFKQLDKTGIILLLGTCGAGTVAFLIGLLLDSDHAWKVFLVNFLLWTGISVAGPVFSAIFELTNARWATTQVRELAESLAGFLPLSLFLYLILAIGGMGSLYPWISDPPAGRAGWFSLIFFVCRGGIALILLVLVSGKFILASRRTRVPESSRPSHLTALAVSTILVYVCAFSLLAVDLVMSMDPDWYSTLFPAYFFMGNLYAGLAMIVVISYLWRRWTGVEEWFTQAIAQDFGKILLGFCLLWTYLMWSQFLVIWYGNLPEELTFLILRSTGSWAPLAWVVLGLCFLVPFTSLITRRMKQPHLLPLVSGVVLVGMWLERFLLIVPSRESGFEFIWVDLLISAGFVALFLLAQAYFSRWLEEREN
ncbi:MAG: hypothetical protein V3R94_12470 [Acidobacteriota bacterium]